MLSQELKERKRRYRELELRKLKAYEFNNLYPVGERHNRELYMRQIQNTPEFKKQLRMMKDMLRGF